MYFSVISVRAGLEREAAQQRAAGPYAEHQWLWRFFPTEAGLARDYIFRCMESLGGLRYYIVSQRPPVAVSNAWQVQTRDYAPQLTAGTHLQFELRANPVVTLKVDGKAARHDVVMQEKRRLLAERGLTRWQDWKDVYRPPLPLLVTEACGQWLTERGARNGFMVQQDCLVVDGYAQHVEKRGKLKFSTVDFRGALVVTDPEAFTRMLGNGLGHAKAFGCGLMLVKRLA